VRLRWKILIGLAVVLAALLALNTVVVNQQTKAAEATVDGAEIMSLPGGDVQVKVDGPTAQADGVPRAPIVLLHCYACSLEWWDEITPLLATDRRVIRVDFLGFGGSEKPSSGYSVEDQAQLVAGALNKLDVQGAVVVGQSMGAGMAVALAEQSSQLVDRVVDISLAADNEASELPLLARLGYTPVLGQAMWRLTPDFAIKQGFKEAFAPDYDVPEEFEDVIVDGYREMTYTSFKENEEALTDYRDEAPLDDRMRAAAVPLMAIFGEEDQIVDVAEAEAGLQDVPGIRISALPGVGHTPQVEAPKETAALIEEFARDAGDEIVSERPPRDVGLDKKAKPDREAKAKRKADRKPNRRNNRQG
jgi:pimeloyl-ACP methyl ester carboxylesterase